MARIALIEPEHANPEVKQIYDGTLGGKPGNAQKALAHRPEMLKNFLSFYASVGRSLDRKLYELIYIRVSFINGCRYCTQHHIASSKLPVLHPASYSFVQARWPDPRRLERPEAGQLRTLQRKRAGCLDVRGKTHSQPARCDRSGFPGVEKAFPR